MGLIKLRKGQNTAALYFRNIFYFLGLLRLSLITYILCYLLRQ